MSGAHLSKEFFELVRAIGESKSKQEEDRIIIKEVGVLKERFAERGITKARLKECLVRLIYVEMLGHDGSFGYVNAIQLTASANLMQKRVGYLCASLTLSPDHEFRFMLVNQLQRDLGSTNMLEVSSALVAVCKLVTEEMVPALLPNITNLLTHEQSAVRKKVAMALHRIYQLTPHSISHLTDKFRRLLCDKDPSVMGAALCLVHSMAKAKPLENKDLAPSMVTILKQIIENNIPPDFTYHHVPAPWIQIKLLQILGVLGKNDRRVSEGMYEALHECLRKAKNHTSPVGYAVIYEFVRTVTTIYPNTLLLDEAAEAISQFIKSSSHNLKYLGVTGLAAIVRDHPKYAINHQLVVLDCLEDPDETLRRKTLDLLYRMTNPINAEVVVDKLLTFLAKSIDKYLKKDLVSRITQLAERYSPNNLWYVKTMTTVFEIGGDLVQPDVAHNLLRLLAEGEAMDDEDAEEGGDMEMRKEACELFLTLLEKPLLPEILLRVMFWTLGEYTYLLGSEELSNSVELLAEEADRSDISVETRGYALSAVVKISAQLGQVDPTVQTLLSKYRDSVDVDLQQRAHEFCNLCGDTELLREVFPLDSSCEDLSDPSFAFLENFANAQLQQGAADYSPPSFESDDEDLDSDEELMNKKPDLKFDAYEKPTLPSAPAPVQPLYNSNSVVENQSTLASAATATTANANGLNLQGVKSKWGSSGYKGELPSTNPVPSNTPMNVGSSSVPTAFAVAEPTQPVSVVKPSVAVDNGFRQTQTSLRAEEAKPAELTEREKMAAALFSGVAPSTRSDTSSRGVTRKSRKAKEQKVQKEQQVEDDLLGLDTIPQSSEPLESTGTYEEIDLLTSLDPMSDTTPVMNVPSPRVIQNILAPLSLSTQEFGGQWVKLASENKLSLANPNRCSFDEMTRLISDRLKVHLIEAIHDTQEAIFAGQCPQGTAFLHAKQRPSLSPPTVDMIIRTTSTELTAIVAKDLVSRFNS